MEEVFDDDFHIVGHRFRNRWNHDWDRLNKTENFKTSVIGSYEAVDIDFHRGRERKRIVGGMEIRSRVTKLSGRHREHHRSLIRREKHKRRREFREYKIDRDNTQLNLLTTNKGEEVRSFCISQEGNVAIGNNYKSCNPLTKFDVNGNATFYNNINVGESVTVTETITVGDSITVANTIVIGDPLAISWEPLPAIIDYLTGVTLIIGDLLNTLTRIQAKTFISFKIADLITIPLFFDDSIAGLFTPFGLAVSNFVSNTGTFIPSDERIKTNIVPFNTTNYLQNFMQFKTYEYSYTSAWCNIVGCNTTDRIHGFISQQIDSIDPSLVSVQDYIINGTVIDLHILKKELFLPYLVQIVQDLVNRYTSLSTQYTAQQTQITTLSSNITTLTNTVNTLIITVQNQANQIALLNSTH